MSKSSRARKAKARARKNAAHSNAKGHLYHSNGPTALSAHTLSNTDKRYLIGFTILSTLITAMYWLLGGRNLFVFPAVFCLAVGARKYWTGPIQHYAEKA